MNNFINFFGSDDEWWCKSERIVVSGFCDNAVFLEDVGQVVAGNMAVAAHLEGVQETSSSDVSDKSTVDSSEASS